MVRQIVSTLQEEIQNLPDNFYSTFSYTVTGQNYTHPITIGILSKVVLAMKDVKFVAVDFRLNAAGVKFQPDLVALGDVTPIHPVLFLDYESPNSSDIRIPKKDVESYEKWSKQYRERIPYFIITTLPDRQVADWQLRYTSEGRTNYNFRGRRQDICMNPFRFWYAEYKRALQRKDLTKIYFINIDKKEVKHIPL